MDPWYVTSLIIHGAKYSTVVEIWTRDLFVTLDTDLFVKEPTQLAKSFKGNLEQEASMDISCRLNTGR